MVEHLDFVTWKDRTYRNCWVSLDNCQFVHCSFEGVQFLYAGGPWKIESDCHIGPGCTLQLQGSAVWTALLVESFRALFGIAALREPPPGQAS